MRLSEKYNLKRTQRELDFVDIDLERDTRLFIDPWLLKEFDTDFNQKCTHYLQSYFSTLLNYISDNDEKKALKILNHLHEIDWTRLGYSVKNIKGKAIADENANQIYKTLKESKAVKSRVLKDLEDTALLIKGIDKDKISDMVTNIVMPLLVEYTLQQSKIYNLELDKREIRWLLWDTNIKDWKVNFFNLPSFNNKPILLVPKSIVSTSLSINSDDFYKKYILTYEQQKYLNNPSLGLCRVLKDGSLRPPSKKTLMKEIVYDVDKIVTYVEEHPELLISYKRDLKENRVKKSRKTRAQIIDDKNIGGNINYKTRAEQLIDELKKIPTGREDANKYHMHVASIINFLFGENLTNMKIEDPISGNTKFIDLSFLNSSTRGFFLDCVKLNIPCRKIYFECKNYNEDIANNELDQLLGRFSVNTTRIGFILCRKLKNRELFIKRCGHEVIKNRNYVIVLTDDDLIEMLNNKIIDEIENTDNLLDNRVEEINNYLQ